MPNTVIALKKSATPSAAPAALANGELAINYADGKLYYKHANGTIAAISSGGGAGDSFGTVNAAGTLIIADTAGDILTLESGSGITITGDSVNDKITIASTVDISPALIQANTARDHANAAFDQANTATTIGSSAFAKANAALANSTGTFNGKLTIANDLVVTGNATFDTDTMYVDATNNRVGIGTTSPISLLHVSANSARLTIQQSIVGSFFSGIDFTSYAGGGTLGGLIFNQNSGEIRLNAAVSYFPTIYSNGTEAVRVTTAGNVGIGINTPTAKLTVANGTSSTSQHIYGTYTDASNYERLSISASTTADIIRTESAGTGASRPLLFGVGGGNQWGLNTSGHLITYGSDNVYDIGTSAGSRPRDVYIAGGLYATTKSFVIDHQSKPNHKLRHGSLEGPENGVYVRGRSKTNVIELPEYWTWLIDDESITVTLTPIGTHQNLYVDKIEDNKVYIKTSTKLNKKIDFFYMINAERKDVEKLEVEIKNDNI